MWLSHCGARRKSGDTHCGYCHSSGLHVDRCAVVHSGKATIIPLHTIAFDQTMILLVKAYTLMMFPLPLYIVDDSFTMTIGDRKSSVFFTPSNKVRKQTALLCPVTARTFDVP